MNNEPVAYVDPIWMDRPDLVMSHQLEIGKLFARTQFKNYVPLYTHPVKEQDESFDRTASHMVGEYVSWTSCVACGKKITGDSIHTCSPQLKQLTDEEISQVYKEVSEPFGEKRLYEIHDFARAILRKASEK